MCLRLRRLLLLLLMACLPIQGWAAGRMAVAMVALQASHASPAAPAAMEGSSPHVPVHQVSPHDHGAAPDRVPGMAHGAAHECGADAKDAAGSNAHAGHCGDTCHCCISAAPPAAAFGLNGRLPTGDWAARAPSPWHTVPTATLDKPPKA